MGNNSRRTFEDEMFGDLQLNKNKFAMFFTNDHINEKKG